VLSQVAELLGLQGASIKSVVQKGLGENARFGDGRHPLLLESRFYAAVELIGRLDFVRSRPRAIPRHRGGFRPVSEAYHPCRRNASGAAGRRRYAKRVPLALVSVSGGDPVVQTRHPRRGIRLAHLMAG